MTIHFLTHSAVYRVLSFSLSLSFFLSLFPFLFLIFSLSLFPVLLLSFSLLLSCSLSPFFEFKQHQKLSQQHFSFLIVPEKRQNLVDIHREIATEIMFLRHDVFCVPSVSLHFFAIETTGCFSSRKKVQHICPAGLFCKL